MKTFCNFPTCGNCFQKEKRDNLNKESYYCRYAVGIFVNGIVTNDIDSTECFLNGNYTPLRK